MTILKFANAGKLYKYDQYPAFENISFEVQSGEVVSLVLGLQGGKTSIARILVGDEKLSQGEAFFDEKPIEDTPPSLREIAFIALPILYDKGRVSKNIRFGLSVRGCDKATARSMAQKQMEKFDLLDFAETRVKKLDLYQQCRLAFARAYLRKVRLAVFDNIIGINAEIDDFVDKMTDFNKRNNIATLFLCDTEAQARGKVYDFRTIDLLKLIDQQGG